MINHHERASHSGGLLPSTAYLFVGVATSQADLNTFLGGCSDGWGFIGEQALYHARESVIIYAIYDTHNIILQPIMPSSTAHQLAKQQQQPTKEQCTSNVTIVTA